VNYGLGQHLTPVSKATLTDTADNSRELGTSQRTKQLIDDGLKRLKFLI